ARPDSRAAPRTLAEARPESRGALPSAGRGAPRFTRGATNLGRGAPRFTRGATNLGRGAPRFTRGATSVGGVWGAMSGPPILNRRDDAGGWPADALNFGPELVALLEEFAE